MMQLYILLSSFSKLLLDEICQVFGTIKSDLYFAFLCVMRLYISTCVFLFYYLTNLLRVLADCWLIVLAMSLVIREAPLPIITCPLMIPNQYYNTGLLVWVVIILIDLPLLFIATVRPSNWHCPHSSQYLRPLGTQFCECEPIRKGVPSISDIKISLCDPLTIPYIIQLSRLT